MRKRAWQECNVTYTLFIESSSKVHHSVWSAAEGMFPSSGFTAIIHVLFRDIPPQVSLNFRAIYESEESARTF